MLFSELADAIELEIKGLPLIDIVRGINSVMMDISEATKITKRVNMTIITPPTTPPPPPPPIIPDRTNLNYGECYSGYTNLEIPTDMRDVNVFINNKKIRTQNQANSFTTRYDSNGLPFFYTDSRRIYFTGVIDKDWALTITGKQVFSQLAHTTVQGDEIDIPVDAKSYIVTLLAFRHYARTGDYNKARLYKGEMEMEKIRLASRLNNRYSDNRGK